MADDAKGDAGKAAPGSERSALEAVENIILRTLEWRRYARLYRHYRGQLLRLFGQMTEGA